MIKDLYGKKTNMHKEVFIAETASVVGDVQIRRGSSIWYGTVVRGDMAYVRIGRYTNVQDNATLHVAKNTPCEIGDYTTIGHNAVVHGCKVGNNCLIGMSSIILNGAVIGDNCIIGTGSLITEGTIIPSNSLVMGSPGIVRREVSIEEIEMVKHNAVKYEKLWKDKYR